MNEEGTLHEAISAALLDAEGDHQLLLQSVVEAARGIFGAAAGSVFLLDAATGELVFEAVSGAGEDFLVGTRFPADRGIAGWVLASGEPLTVDDLDANPLFARDLAESTRYTPRSIMAAPLLCDEGAVGVLEVLDRTAGYRPMDEVELLALFARQAAVALNLIQRNRAVRQVFLSQDADFSELSTLVRILDGLRGPRREEGLAMIRSVGNLLAAEDSH